MLFYIVLGGIIFGAIVLFYYLRSKNSGEGGSLLGRDETDVPPKIPSYVIKPFSKQSSSKAFEPAGKTAAVKEVLPAARHINKTEQFNWEKIHRAINPTGDKEIERQLTDLIREEREYIVVRKFLYFAEKHPDEQRVGVILDIVKKESVSHQTLLEKFG